MNIRDFAVAVAVVSLMLGSAGCSDDADVDPSAHATANEGGASVTPDAPPAHEQAADHAGHDQAAPVLAEGQRWATDAPLRAAMTRIRDTVADNLPAYHEGRLQVEDADALAIGVGNDIDYMVANCELDPEPDAALHVLIGRMMGATGALKTDPASVEGMPQLVAVVNDYQATFDHEGLQPLTHD
ncbi:hypothetical protein ACW7G0_07110 [Lysobacter sp. A286]